ncbi:hypothetical protein HPB51_020072 [Rhipicephalus microplus]|uniref:THAP-type domain-containing protein n=1 Tax=Rhipicephalus microplus TaxID=6941 RepID=A0A9J6E3S3_RHIMP|nr:hypothetical protein HPB51_020072 [Rhipicephalus microplus]
MVYCCVPFCKSSDRRSTGISFHEFPVTQIRQEWLKKISRQAEAGYRLLREIGVLTLPSRCTLKRYIGACTGEVVSSLTKQRLHAEVKLHSKEARCGSLVMNEMSLKQSALYHKQSDALHGFVDLGGAEVDYGLEEQLATRLLCFVFVGLSTHYRLLWLENECLIYFDLWKESTAHNLEFLSEETYEALRVTTMSTVLCTRHLLGRGFHFVLTGKFSSDDVESLFSTIRQLNGSNDQTGAYAALSSLQKILVTGCIHSSPSGNVGSVIGSIGEATKLAPQPAAAAPPDKDIKKLLLPYLTALECFPMPDVLHMRIRVVNRLIDGLLAEAEDRDNRNSVTNVSAKGVHVGAIVDVINSCSVKFEVWMEEKRGLPDVPDYQSQQSRSRICTHLLPELPDTPKHIHQAQRLVLSWTLSFMS